MPPRRWMRVSDDGLREAGSGYGYGQRTAESGKRKAESTIVIRRSSLSQKKTASRYLLPVPVPAPSRPIPVAGLRLPRSQYPARPDRCKKCKTLDRSTSELTKWCIAELGVVQNLHACLDRRNLAVYAFRTMILASHASSNPGNNRPLPQNLWDAFDRSGMSAIR